MKKNWNKGSHVYPFNFFMFSSNNIGGSVITHMFNFHIISYIFYQLRKTTLAQIKLLHFIKPNVSVYHLESLPVLFN